MDGYWGQKELDRLIEMAANGSTYLEIAEDIGTTRSAVAGKIKRIKVHHAKRRNITTINQNPIKKRDVTPRQKAICESKKQVLIKELIKAPTSKIDFDKCVYPIGDQWCGGDLHNHSAYCKDHHYIVYARPPARSKR